MASPMKLFNIFFSQI